MKGGQSYLSFPLSMDFLVCLPIRLTVGLSGGSNVRFSIRRPSAVRPSIDLVRLTLCISVYTYTYLCLFLCVHLSVSIPLFPSVCPSYYVTHLSVCRYHVQGAPMKEVGSVPLTSSLRNLVFLKVNNTFIIKSSWAKLVSTRRSNVLSLPFK